MEASPQEDADPRLGPRPRRQLAKSLATYPTYPRMLKSDGLLEDWWYPLSRSM
jgi:hypothetical protein